MRVLLGEGFGLSPGGWWGGFPVENEGTGEGGGNSGGWVGDRQRNLQVNARARLSKLPFSKLPWSQKLREAKVCVYMCISIYVFRINCVLNFESDCESKFRGEVSM